MIAAWGASLADLPADHVAWAVEADYCAQIAAMLILIVSPAKLVFGGGVMKQQALFGPLRDRTAALLAGYGRDTDRAALETRILPPACREAPRADRCLSAWRQSQRLKHVRFRTILLRCRSSPLWMLLRADH